MSLIALVPRKSAPTCPRTRMLANATTTPAKLSGNSSAMLLPKVCADCAALGSPLT